MSQFDLRRIRIGIEISGRINWYEGLKVRVTGTKYASPEQNDCTVVITNLKRSVRDYLVTEASPFNSNPNPKRLIVEAGRVSTGVMRIFVGDIVSAEPGLPPDIDLTIYAKTQNTAAGKIVAKSGAAQTSLSTLAAQAAKDLGLTLEFQADDKNIGNYNHTGSALAEVGKLQTAGGVAAYIDDNKLVMKNSLRPLNNRVRILDKNRGMVGIPKPTEKGLKVTFLIDNETVLGGGLQLKSQMNPAANGDYVITQLAFDLASHDNQFWYTALATRL